MLNEVGEGYKFAIETRNGGRIGAGAQMVGVAREELNCVNYTRSADSLGKSSRDAKLGKIHKVASNIQLHTSAKLILGRV